MNIQRYQDLLQDKNVIKLNSRIISSTCLVTKNKLIVIEFIFCHKGFESNSVSASNKRIKLKAFPYENLNKKLCQKLIEINGEALVLVNADYEIHAMTFIINTDEKELTAEVKIYDYPQAATGIISEEERNGIKLKINSLPKGR